jgi:DnaJ-class molecular chaperone
MPRFSSGFDQERLLREAANAFKASAHLYAQPSSYMQRRAYTDAELTVETAIRMASSKGGGHYEKLGLTRTATSGEIRKRFLLLAKLLHPDKTAQRSGGEDVAQAAEEAFKEVAKAYHALR